MSPATWIPAVGLALVVVIVVWLMLSLLAAGGAL